ncbi:c-type cytochrome [Stigmatella sp. ncwal1]|uniref:C-type cytochrome n=1 Tax=Stigmatella ashevillensis TaxID=2995309 RepID=A0ABT5DFE9_9BACT|nr:c-type cytochrome [Stigmatella ashevillena]MDC0712294.1 c-type cytochrome [Stigmatella ashevillena]
MNGVVCVLAVLVSLSSGLWVLRARGAQPRREVEQGGLRLRLDQATWLHEPMDHGDAVRLPTGQGAPGVGQRHLAVALTLFNVAQAPADFTAQELVLTAENGQEWFPVEQEEARLSVRPAQLLPLPLGFNIPASAGWLRLEWVRGTERAVLLSTRPPPGGTSQVEGQERWPQSAEGLPPGSPRAGAVLFHERFACVACHGSPEFQGEVHAAPSLHGFAKAGAARVAGMSAAQYAYESLLFPGAFIAPGCAGNVPCQEPSLMPVYGDALSAQEMADLISYLLGQRERP